MARVLFLLSTESYRAGAFLAAARERGVEVTVGSDRAQALAHVNPAGHLVVALHRPVPALERIRAFAAEHPVDAVIGTDDDGALLAARAAEALGLHAHPASGVMLARDKARAREAFAAAGLRSPRFAVVPLAAGAAAALAHWSAEVAHDPGGAAIFPCVLKPRGLAASRGVIRADDPGQFQQAFERIAAILAREPRPGPEEPPTDSLLVETYLPGAEVALEGLMTHGELRVLALFDKPDPLEGPYFEETIYVTPSRLDVARQVEIAEAARRGALALGLRHGPVHAEFRVGPDGVAPLEIAPRSIGGLCSRALRFDGGRTLESVLLAHALGEIDLPARESNASGVMMVPIPRAGSLREVRGGEEARAVPGITELRLTIPPGSRLVPLPEGAQYLGFLFARGATPETVEQALRSAHARLTFDIEEPGIPGEENSEA